ncbi:hypothetical protein [uncultured Clostridium sp.]|uniref:hypothetical protein n=1 Tax=uncultured Clostridium sp. TaxID=59620 RepID=UPI0025CE79E9|nr:hypothetical protein [uncultured Clostridium sp.]
MAENIGLEENIKEIIKGEISEKSYRKYFNYGCHSANFDGDTLTWYCRDESIASEVRNFYKPFILAACTSLNLDVKNINIEVK